MDCVATDDGAVLEAVAFLSFFKDLPDPRQPGKVTYPLDEVLLLALLAVLAGAETFVDIARFGERKLDLLRRFRLVRGTTPSDGWLRRQCANPVWQHFRILGKHPARRLQQGEAGRAHAGIGHGSMKFFPVRTDPLRAVHAKKVAKRIQVGPCQVVVWPSKASFLTERLLCT